MKNDTNLIPLGMTLIGKQLLYSFAKKHTDSSKWIENWVSDVEGSIWKTPQDIKNKYPSASFLENNTVIFNVKGNHYRLEVKVAYKLTTISVRWIGTHKEYDRRNKE